MMTVTAIQHSIAWADGAANRAHLEQMLLRAPGAQLYVLPEMFATGFATQPEGIAEPAEGGPTLRWMHDMARQTGAAIAGSVAVSSPEAPQGHAEGRCCRNRFYFVKPSGETAFYDKHHLFAYGGEDRHYLPGERRVVVEWQGVRFLLQVCYDLRFPVWSRCRADYDAVLYVASWPASRRKVWDALLLARALENQCYAVGANRVGTDPATAYSGGTTVIDAYGRTLASCPDDEEGYATARIDLEALAAFRSKFPVLAHADRFSLYEGCPSPYADCQ